MIRVCSHAPVQHCQPLRRVGVRLPPSPHTHRARPAQHPNPGVLPNIHTARTCLLAGRNAACPQPESDELLLEAELTARLHSEALQRLLLLQVRTNSGAHCIPAPRHYPRHHSCTPSRSYVCAFQHSAAHRGKTSTAEPSPQPSPNLCHWPSNRVCGGRQSWSQTAPSCPPHAPRPHTTTSLPPPAHTPPSTANRAQASAPAGCGSV
jgi:hypothetical protein